MKSKTSKAMILKQNMMGWRRYKNFPFYDWDNQDYQNFMVAMIRSLETRYFHPQQVICKELEQALEFYFVQQGRYNVGYEINKIIKYRI